MSQQETIAPASSTPSRKQRRKEIVDKLTGALSEYKQDLGGKKLANYFRKASKLISRDLEKSIKKHKEGEKKEEYKKTPNRKKDKHAKNKAPKKIAKKTSPKA